MRIFQWMQGLTESYALGTFWEVVCGRGWGINVLYPVLVANRGPNRSGEVSKRRPILIQFCFQVAVCMFLFCVAFRGPAFSKIANKASQKQTCFYWMPPSSDQGQLPTIMTKSIFWVPFLQRWLLPRELALCHGFPVTAATARAAGVPTDSAQYTAKQIGNSMHLANVGIVMGIALGCLEKIK